MNTTNMLNSSSHSCANRKIIYTDGSAHNSDAFKGLGSWAYLTVNDSDLIEVIGMKLLDTTNNRAEMLAVISALVDNQGQSVHIISDSGYVVTGYTHPSYLDKWLVTNWLTRDNTPVKNVDLWQELMVAVHHTPATFELIRGHKKDPNPVHAFYNDIVDRACTWIKNTKQYDGKKLRLLYSISSKKFERVEVIE